MVQSRLRAASAARIASWPFPDGLQSDTISSMDPALIIRTARTRSGLSLRDLAMRAKTSHSTLAAYEAGRKVPSIITFERVLRAAGFDLESTLVSSPVSRTPDRGRELIEVLELAAMFPARHDSTLGYPKFGPK